MRKLSYGYHNEDSQMTMKEVIRIPVDETELQRIRDCEILVAKFLLFKHAWKILRQLYMAASAKKMLLTMDALGTSKSMFKFLVLLRNRTEFTKKTILGNCIGESKYLRRSWNTFHLKIDSHNRKVMINSIINKMVKKHYFRKNCCKLFRYQKTRCYFKQVAVSAVVYSTLRRLKKAMVDLKAHTWFYSKSSTGDRIGGYYQLKRARILHNNYMLQNFLLSWKASAHHGRLTAYIEKKSHHHCCRQRLARGMRHLRMLTVRAQSLKLKLEAFHRNVIRDMLLRRALRCMRNRVEIYYLQKDEEDYAGHRHLRYIASRALNVWSASSRNSCVDSDRLDMSSSYVMSRSRKRYLTRWLARRREVSSYCALTTFAADSHKKRMLSKFFVKWLSSRKFNIAVTIVSKALGTGLGKNIADSAYRKSLRIIEYGEESQRTLFIPRHALLLFKTWSAFCKVLRVRKAFTQKLSAARDYRLRSLMKMSFGAFLAIHQEHLSILHNSDRHVALRSQYNAFHRLERITFQAYESRERESYLAIRISDLKLRRAFRSLLALTKTSSWEGESSSGILNAALSVGDLTIQTDVPSLPVASFEDRGGKPSVAVVHTVLRLGAKSSSLRISSQVHGVCAEKRTTYMLRVAITALRKFKNISRSYYAVRLIRKKLYANILFRQWRDLKAARGLLNTCYKVITTNTLQHYFSQWVADEKVFSLLFKLSLKKQRETVSRHFRLWVAYISKTHMDRNLFRPKFGAYEGKVLLKKHFYSFVTQLKQWGPVSRRAEAASIVGNREMMRKAVRKWRLQTQRPFLGSDSEGARRGGGRRDSGSRKLKKSWETAAARRARGVLVAQCRGRYLQSWVIACFLDYTEDRAQLHLSKKALDSYLYERLSRGVFTVLRGVLRRRHHSQKVKAAYEKACRASALSRAVSHIDRHCVSRWIYSQKMRRAELQSRIVVLKRGFRKLLLCTRKKRLFFNSTVLTTDK
jgi:hypothetical protein